MTDEQIASAQKSRSEGMSYRKIASALGVSSSSLYSKLNPQRKKEHDARYYASHKDEFRIHNAEYRATHKEELGQYREDHIGEIHLRERRHREAHREERRLYQVKYNEGHREDSRAYCREHLAEYAARQSVRRAMIAGATIGNLVEIKEIYRKAKEEPKIRCYLCGELIPMGRRHVDHIMPLSKGGAHRPSNLAVACDTCNLSKHDKMPEDVGLLL